MRKVDWISLAMYGTFLFVCYLLYKDTMEDIKYSTTAKVVAFEDQMRAAFAEQVKAHTQTQEESS
jgi:hypothetical protein